MNYNYPFYNFIPSGGSAAKSAGILGGIFKNGINWSSILNNTQKTLGVINQAIPVVKEISPIFNNAKTMFNVLNEFKKNDTPSSSNNTKSTNAKNNVNNMNYNRQVNDNKQNDNLTSSPSQEGPTFFI